MAPASSPPPPPLTVGEANSRSIAPRAFMWVAAVCLPSMFMAFAAAVAYCIYSSDSALSVVVPKWWLPPVMLWGAYNAVVYEVVFYVHLFLPRAPFAVPRALVDVGICWVGIPLGWTGFLVAFLGHQWMAVAWSGLMVLVIAGVVAYCVCLARTYGSSTTEPPATG